MATKKKAPGKAAPQRPSHSEAYEQATADFAAAVELVGKGKFDEAIAAFEELSSLPDEPALTERCRAWMRIGKRRKAAAGAGGDEQPVEPEACYSHAVLAINDGDADAAIRLLDQAVQTQPRAPHLLYARASAWAIKGQADKAVEDLRQAIAGEPTLRFQAVNDPDFEPIREEPAFIDIIEPTPTGA